MGHSPTRAFEYEQNELVTTYELPKLGPGAETVSYELARFPTQPWCLTRSRGFASSDDVVRCAEWINEVAMAERRPVIEQTLLQLGAPSVDTSDPIPGLLALAQWLQEWFPKVADPFVQNLYPSVPGWRQHFLTPDGDDRLGQVNAWSWPHMTGYSELGDSLLHSLIVDLASIVTACAQVREASLGWSSQLGDYGFQLALNPAEPPYSPLVQIRDLLEQSAGPPRGERGRRLRQRQSNILLDCYTQATTGIAPPSIQSEFPEQQHRMFSRFLVKRPTKSAPGVPSHLVDTVSSLRTIGLYEKWKHSDKELAQALGAAWRFATGRTLPEHSDELWWCLLFLDSDRTWFEDVDMAIRGVGDRLYGETLFGIGLISRGLGAFSDPEEDWHSVPGSVQVSVRWRRKKQRFT